MKEGVKQGKISINKGETAYCNTKQIWKRKSVFANTLAAMRKNKGIRYSTGLSIDQAIFRNAAVCGTFHQNTNYLFTQTSQNYNLWKLTEQLNFKNT